MKLTQIHIINIVHYLGESAEQTNRYLNILTDVTGQIKAEHELKARHQQIEEVMPCIYDMYTNQSLLSLVISIYIYSHSFSVSSAQMGEVLTLFKSFFENAPVAMGTVEVLEEQEDMRKYHIQKAFDYNSIHQIYYVYLYFYSLL